jgi:hypothetical protein
MTTEKTCNYQQVDKGLIAMFLRMTVEERLSANDDSATTVLELRDAFQKRKNKKHQKTSNACLFLKKP